MAPVACSLATPKSRILPTLAIVEAGEEDVSGLEIDGGWMPASCVRRRALGRLGVSILAAAGSEMWPRGAGARQVLAVEEPMADVRAVLVDAVIEDLRDVRRPDLALPPGPRARSGRGASARSVPCSASMNLRATSMPSCSWRAALRPRSHAATADHAIEPELLPAIDHLLGEAPSKGSPSIEARAGAHGARSRRHVAGASCGESGRAARCHAKRPTAAQHAPTGSPSPRPRGPRPGPRSGDRSVRSGPGLCTVSRACAPVPPRRDAVPHLGRHGPALRGRVLEAPRIRLRRDRVRSEHRALRIHGGHGAGRAHFRRTQRLARVPAAWPTAWRR